MAKTEETIRVEQQLWDYTQKTGVFGCFEVTIGIGGRERVDYLTYDTKGIWRCYEIKTSVSDFYSNAELSFVGNYNYFVLTKEVYEKVKQNIPKHIGVIIDKDVVKRPKKQKLKVSEDILKDSMIRSLSRENQKYQKSKNISEITQLKKKMSSYKSLYKREKKERKELEKEMRLIKTGFRLFNKNIGMSFYDFIIKVEKTI